ncbi:hypothetical protein THAOC_03335 [Thalassiosira oceanica]|uniref:Uncharacterized protein n=1 Tax=Thalassiosira oceanica TaxID=159749 RepID=K0T813_THAOC|nr:hypothetical protein THAOC_03335 [Thalassiosira oceanica]|eukprot:EJK74958.1 hypothetical protein THAOC_03335 [Thalassiosira oceanica]
MASSCAPASAAAADVYANCGQEDGVKLKNCTACLLHKKACKERAAELKDEKLCGQGHEWPESGFVQQRRGSRSVKARAQSKDPDAMKYLGDLYRQGIRGLLSRAVQLWNEAAELGSVESYYHLGLCYTMGDGIEDTGKVMICTRAIYGLKSSARGDRSNDTMARRAKRLKHIVCGATIFVLLPGRLPCLVYTVLCSGPPDTVQRSPEPFADRFREAKNVAKGVSFYEKAAMLGHAGARQKSQQL